MTTPKTWPADCELRDRRIWLDFNEAGFEAEFSRLEEFQSHGGGTSDRWVGVWATTQLEGADIAKAEAFIASLKGRQGKFFAYDPDRRYPSSISISSALYAGSTSHYAGATTTYAGAGTIACIGTVNGGGQSGNTVSLLFSAMTSQTIPAGTYFQIGKQLFMTTEDVDTNGSGVGTFNFEPALRVSPVNGASVFMMNPVMIARLDEQWQGADTGAAKFGVVSFSFHEVLDG